MKLLVDSCVWGGVRENLSQHDHDVVWVGDWDRDPGDDALLKIAHEQQRVLITLDKDFGELVVVRQRPHAGVLRIVGLGARRQGAAVIEALEKHGALLQAGGVVTVEPGRIRVRPAGEE
ncbi:MAG: toxin-antitoxin system, toxin component, PIN family protein [Phycisphaeraceae bacterium]|nr:MAG: toxin-antitoxin system, toxin component, PIN family protein [Phycisphaeraceae bacterium]